MGSFGGFLAASYRDLVIRGDCWALTWFFPGMRDVGIPVRATGTQLQENSEIVSFTAQWLLLDFVGMFVGMRGCGRGCFPTLFFLVRGISGACVWNETPERTLFSRKSCTARKRGALQVFLRERKTRFCFFIFYEKAEIYCL